MYLGKLKRLQRLKRKEQVQQHQANIFLGTLIFGGLLLFLFLYLKNAVFAPAAEKLTVTLRGDSIDIPSTISIISVVVAVGAGLGLLVGIPVGFSIMTCHIKHSIRKRV